MAEIKVAGAAERLWGAADKDSDGQDLVLVFVAAGKEPDDVCPCGHGRTPANPYHRAVRPAHPCLRYLIRRVNDACADAPGSPARSARRGIAVVRRPSAATFARSALAVALHEPLSALTVGEVTRWITRHPGRLDKPTKAGSPASGLAAHGGCLRRPRLHFPPDDDHADRHQREPAGGSGARCCRWSSTVGTPAADRASRWRLGLRPLP